MTVSQYPTPAPLVTWVYTNAAARTGASGFSGGDVNKFALQLDNATIWRLVTTGPTWFQEPNGPIINKFRDFEPVWPTLVIKKMKDGGANTTMSNLTPEYRWELLYKKVSKPSSDQLVAMLDAHFQEALSFALGFNFRHPKTGVMWADVHYEEFDRPDHGKRVEQQMRRVVLVKWPAG